MTDWRFTTTTQPAWLRRQKHGPIQPMTQPSWLERVLTWWRG